MIHRLGCESCGEPHGCICHRMRTCEDCGVSYEPEPYEPDGWNDERGLCPECAAEQDREEDDDEA